MPDGYDDSDLNDEDRFFQCTVMQNLISGGGFKAVRIRKSTISRPEFDDEDF